MLPVIYSECKFQDLHAHINHLLSIQDSYRAAEILFTNLNLTFPLKIITYKTKPNVIEVRILSGSVGRDNLILLDDHLEKKGYDLRRRKSHKLKLLSAINVHISFSSHMVVAEVVTLLKDILTFLNIPIEQKITIGYPMGYESHELPGEFSYRDGIAQLGYKIGRSIGSIVRRIKNVNIL